MNKIAVCVLAGCVAVSVSACSGIGDIIGNIQKMSESEDNTAETLFEEVGDMMDGLPPETEIDVIVDDEDAAEAMTEAAVPESEAQTEKAAVKAETEAETETESDKAGGPLEAVVSEILSQREAMGEHWSVAYEDLKSGEIYGYHDEDVMQSASVVKLFIMGAVYRYMCYPPEGEEVIPFNESYDGQLRDTIVSMITVSDNDCANLLIDKLGGGDFALGAQRIKKFCEENGYTGTSVGRRFLEQNPSGDNYTTAADQRKFLSDLYHGTLINEEASAKMLEIVKGQTRRNKIPSGLPAGFSCGNKTGEMPEGYGLGCIENDSAIVFPPEGMGEGYVLTVMSNDLGGRNSEAINVIVQISAKVVQWYTEQYQ
ncbi:MAG: serine hydrolase [Lachnospiraceae bacterium]|nr:serine hydrolase [Lachnospiraceae bacterium]